MIDVLSLVDQVRVRSARLNVDLAARFSLPAGDSPIGGFNMVNQYAVVALELLNFYNSVWGSLPAIAVSDPNQTRQENAERVMTVTKATFVLSLSAFEFSAKQALVMRPGKIAPIAGRVYLRKIVEESISAGLIPPADDKPWEGLIELRNILVHNDGIADRTATYPVPGGPTITLLTGKMTQGNLKFFPELLLWSIDGFGRWCEGYLK